MPIIVPGIGYIGLGSQTPANQAVFRRIMGGRKGSSGPRTRGGRARSRRRAATRATGANRRRSSASGPKSTRARSNRRSMKGRLVKGSATAKRHMAKIRKMRK